MLKTTALSSITGLILVGFPFAGFAQPSDSAQRRVCQTFFERNKTKIENLAASGDTTAIRDMFAKAGCPGAVVSVHKPPTSPTAKVRWHCTITFGFPPPTISARCELI